jgi:DNA helicase HerA-like ATPase
MSTFTIEEKAIGRVKGAGETTYEFIFITPDQNHSKVGEYIYYTYLLNTDTKENQPAKVLCRVTSINPIRNYPNEMLANPVLNPCDVAQIIDYKAEGMEIYEITAQIIGYFDSVNKTFINPRSLPNSGDPVFLADKTELSDWLFQKYPDEDSSADVGFLLTRKNENIRVVLNVDKITSTHLAILAATGSGKSYTVGVILEELMKAKNRGAILVFDPHGEYRTFLGMETNPNFQGPDGYAAVANVIDPNKIHIKFSELAFSEIVRMLEGLSDKMRYILRSALNQVAHDIPNYTVKDLTDHLETLKTINENEANSIDGILWRIHEFIRSRPLISDKDHKKLPELIKPGQITVLDMVQLEERDQQLTTSVILNRILKSRISSVRNVKYLDDSEKLDYPVFIVLEEGHRFAPANEDSSSKTILKTILSEGRKFGIGVLIVSQRPGKLDSDVLSQCMTQIIMKITNPVDQQNIRNSVESVSADIMLELPGLTRGQAIVAGDAINTPVMVQIRNRLISPGGSSILTGKEWKDKWKAAPKQISVSFEEKSEKPLY